MWYIVPLCKDSDKLKYISLEGNAIIRREDGHDCHVVVCVGNRVNHTGIQNQTVSRCKGARKGHAEMTIEGGKLYLWDLGSQNGTFVNETRLPRAGQSKLSKRMELKKGDLVRLGPCSEFKVEEKRNNLTIRKGETVVLPRNIVEAISNNADGEVSSINEAGEALITGARQGRIIADEMYLDVIAQDSTNFELLHREIGLVKDSMGGNMSMFYKKLNTLSNQWGETIKSIDESIYIRMNGAYREYSVDDDKDERTTTMIKETLEELQRKLFRRKR